MERTNESHPLDGVRSLCRIYRNFSIAFFVLMLIYPPAMFITLLGTHAPYSVFVLVIKAVSEWEIITPGVHVLILLTALEVSFFAAFIKTTKLALKANKVLPFLILAIGSHALTIALFASTVIESGSVYIPLDLVCSIIANTIFLILLSIRYRKAQKAEVGGRDGTVTGDGSVS